MTWYDEEVADLIRRRDALPFDPQTIFYGSSTIRLWESLPEDFKDSQPVNLGFGGSTLAACVWFFDRLVAPLQRAQLLYLYAGDNDLGDGREPEEVLSFFEEFSEKMHLHLPQVDWYFISIKPSISRWNINDKIKRTNELIQTAIKTQHNKVQYLDIYDAMLDQNGYPNPEYFDDDGLHLSPKGYEVWKQIVITQHSLSSRSV